LAVVGIVDVKTGAVFGALVRRAHIAVIAGDGDTSTGARFTLVVTGAVLLVITRLAKCSWLHGTFTGLGLTLVGHARCIFHITAGRLDGRGIDLALV